MKVPPPSEAHDINNFDNPNNRLSIMMHNEMVAAQLTAACFGTEPCNDLETLFEVFAAICDKLDNGQ